MAVRVTGMTVTVARRFGTLTGDRGRHVVREHLAKGLNGTEGVHLMGGDRSSYGAL